MAEYMLEVLGEREGECETVVVPSGSCASMLRHGYKEILGEERAGTLERRTRELSELLLEAATRQRKEDGGKSGLGASTQSDSARSAPAREADYASSTRAREADSVSSTRANDEDCPDGRLVLGDGLRGRRIAYHHGCHAMRELGVRDEPIALLRACGAEIVPWEAAEECCGFGGLFSTKFPEVSAAMADRKLETLAKTGADAVASADPGCLMQLGGRMARQGDATPALHLATLLREGIESGEGSGGGPELSGSYASAVVGKRQTAKAPNRGEKSRKVN